jgi:molecular chaperone DnaK
VLRVIITKIQFRTTGLLQNSVLQIMSTGMKAGAPAVGIDLGTTFSVVAHLDKSGRPRTILNAVGEPLTPSVVLFDPNSAVVGKEAVKAGVLEPERIAEFAKRDMGCDAYSKVIDGEHYPPEVIQSFVLEKLKRDAQEKIGPFRKAVITVPAYFNEPRRKATQDAGHLAGIEVLDIINEPTAAAIDFGFEQGLLNAETGAATAETIMVYDLGGGTFDVTVMKIEGTRFTAVATAGDVYLGGIDWDRRLAEHLAEQFRNQFRFDPKANPIGWQRLLATAEDAKRALSAREKTTVVFEYSGHVLKTTIGRGDFDKLTADLLERTRLTVRNVLRDANMGWKEVTRLLVVGGSTRMPMVQRMLEEESGQKIDRTLSADEAVAHGAAIYAGLLLNDGHVAQTPITIRNVNSHNLGILGVEASTGRPRTKVMIPRNTALPAKTTRAFKTHQANQANVVVRVVEGGDPTGQNSTPVGRCVVRGLPPNLPAQTPVEVTFEYEQNGRLTVAARLPTIGRTATLALDRSSGLAETALHDWSGRLKKMRPPQVDEVGPAAATGG